MSNLLLTDLAQALSRSQQASLREAGFWKKAHQLFSFELETLPEAYRCLFGIGELAGSRANVGIQRRRHIPKATTFHGRIDVQPETAYACRSDGNGLT